MGLMDPLDATLMTAELLGNPMHVGIVLVLRPPAGAGPGYVDGLYEDALRAGIEVDPRLLRRPHRGLDTGGLWGWQDVEKLDLPRHVERRTLAPDSGPVALWDLVGELHERPLDRSRPMWEACLVEGLEDGRFALYAKIHHALLDGISGLRLIEQSMTTDPEQRDMPPFFGATAEPRSGAGRRGRGLPNPVEVLRSAAAGVGLAGRIVEGQAGNLVEGLTGDTTVLPFRAPRTRFNGSLGPDRAFAAGSWSRQRLHDVRVAAAERTGLDVTGNDVVTAMIAGALRSWSIEHDELPTRSLVAICPVSVRSRDLAADQDAGGNAFGTAICNLGTDRDDPVARLETIHRSMDAAKARVARLGSLPSLLVAAPSILPTVVLPMLPLDPGLPPGYNLPISNVPGPREDLYWNGAHLEEMYPVSVVYDGMGLNVTVCSYAGNMGFGYVAGREVVPDPQALVPHTEDALVELEKALVSA